MRGEPSAKEQVVVVDGYEVKITYAKQSDPDALSAMRTILEKQQYRPNSAPKIDDSEDK